MNVSRLARYGTLFFASTTLALWFTEPRIAIPAQTQVETLLFDPAPDDWAAVLDEKTGKVIGMVQTLDGQRHGWFWMQHPNGKMAVRGEYRFGRLHGRWWFYDTTGRCTRLEQWWDGVLLQGCRGPVWLGKPDE